MNHDHLSVYHIWHLLTNIPMFTTKCSTVANLEDKLWTIAIHTVSMLATGKQSLCSSWVQQSDMHRQQSDATEYLPTISGTCHDKHANCGCFSLL